MRTLPISSNSINAQIRSARPRLYIAWPLTHAIVCLYIGFNFVMGMYFWLVPSAYAVATINKYVGLDVWGFIFFCTGVALSWGLFRNDWQFIRGAMMFGVLIKAIWTYALFASMLDAGIKLLGVTAMWVLILGLQAVTVVYFAPKAKAVENVGDPS
jgi:hypothetical protein